MEGKQEVSRLLRKYGFADHRAASRKWKHLYKAAAVEAKELGVPLPELILVVYESLAALTHVAVNTAWPPRA